MKCPKCGYNQKAKYGLTCNGCKYRFAFNPKEAPRMTDKRFMALINKASGGDTRYFTVNQLYYTFVKRANVKPVGCLVGQIVVSLIAGGIAWAWLNEDRSFNPLVGAGIAVAVIFVLLEILKRWEPKPITIESFRKDLLNKWKGVHGNIPKLIDNPGLNEPPADSPFGDVLDYGVERVVVVQHDHLVDLLVLNGWHAENKALVIAESGYPNYLLSHARKMLDEDPNLPIFLLHDASHQGMTMGKRVAAEGKLPLLGRQVIDMGLTPDDAQAIKKLKVFRKGKNASPEVPVDLLPYSSLALGLGAAVVGGVAFAQILSQEAQNQAAFAVSGGFG